MSISAKSVRRQITMSKAEYELIKIRMKSEGVPFSKFMLRALWAFYGEGLRVKAKR